MSHRESWDEYRRRMLRETERFIEYGLAHPEDIIEIPAKPVGTEGFPRQISDWFWQTVLAEKTTSAIARWKEVLRSRPKRFRGKGGWLTGKLGR